MLENFCFLEFFFLKLTITRYLLHLHIYTPGRLRPVLSNINGIPGQKLRAPSLAAYCRLSPFIIVICRRHCRHRAYTQFIINTQFPVPRPRCGRQVYVHIFTELDVNKSMSLHRFSVIFPYEKSKNYLFVVPSNLPLMGSITHYVIYRPDQVFWSKSCFRENEKMKKIKSE